LIVKIILCHRSLLKSRVFLEKPYHPPLGAGIKVGWSVGVKSGALSGGVIWGGYGGTDTNQG